MVQGLVPDDCWFHSALRRSRILVYLIMYLCKLRAVRCLCQDGERLVQAAYSLVQRILPLLRTLPAFHVLVRVGKAHGRIALPPVFRPPALECHDVEIVANKTRAAELSRRYRFDDPQVYRDGRVDIACAPWVSGIEDFWWNLGFTRRFEGFGIRDSETTTRSA